MSLANILVDNKFDLFCRDMQARQHTCENMNCINLNSSDTITANIIQANQYIGPGTIIGPTGPTGPQGIQGIQGEIGPTGPTGPLNYKFRKEVNTAIYNVLETDSILGVIYTQTGPCSIILPEINTMTKQFTEINVVDEGGNALINNITILPSGSDNILGASGYILNNNYNSICLYNNPTDSWFVI